MNKNERVFVKPPRYVFRKKNILNWVGKMGASSFIDVGCGAGELACTLAERGLKGLAVDFSGEAVKSASLLQKKRNISKDRLEFRRVAANEPMPKNAYDLTICCEVLEHVEHDEVLLKKLIATSKRYVLISVPARQKLFDEWDTMVGHYRRYDKGQLVALLEQHGLTVVRFASYGYPFINIVKTLRRLFTLGKTGLDSGSMASRSKTSGINPIKIPAIMKLVDLEILLTPLYWLSKPFNRFDLSEGYLVLCEKLPKSAPKK